MSFARRLSGQGFACVLAFQLAVGGIGGLAFQVPSAQATLAQDTITFYGELTNQATDIPVSGNLDVMVRVYDSSTGGSPLWDECWEDASVYQGRVSLHLGAINPFQNALGMSLGEFLSANPKLFVEIQVCDARSNCGDPDSAVCDEPMVPRMSLGAVPYA